jgi:hypothetical protein
MQVSEVTVTLLLVFVLDESFLVLFFEKERACLVRSEGGPDDAVSRLAFQAPARMPLPIDVKMLSLVSLISC